MDSISTIMTGMRSSLIENQTRLMQALALLGPCTCRAKRTWWGKRKPVEHTQHCLLGEALRVDIDLALVRVREALDDTTLENVNAFSSQMDEVLIAGCRWRATV